jgi:hypothetical protein
MTRYKKKLIWLSDFLQHVRRNIVNLDSVLTIFSFIALNKCLASGGKVVFSRESKCHLSIDQG